MLKTCVLPAFGTTLLARVEQPAVATWVAGMRARGLSASRIRQAYRVMSSLMAAAVQGGYLARTPCTGIRLPRAARRDATLLTAAEVDRLAEAAGEYGTLIYLLAYGGLRWGEVAALRRRRCDLLRRRVEVGGCLGRQRAAALRADQDVRAAVGAAARLPRPAGRPPPRGVGPDPDELVFRGQRGAPLRYQSFRRALWDRAVADADLPDGVTPHCLRHTCASLLVAGGADPVAVQRHLGHRDVTTTMNVYAGLFPNRLDEIAAALDGFYQAAQSAG